MFSRQESGPFGNPDGSRADIEELLHGFVTFGNEMIWGGLATKGSDRKARVLVGRKGSGKTVYLRRLQANAAAESSLYADAIQSSGPTTESIVKFCQLFPDNILTEKWVELWRRAILRSVVAHLLNTPKLRNTIPASLADQLRKDYGKILIVDYKSPVSTYSQVAQIIELNHTAKVVNAYFNNPLWDELEWIISECIKYCPPLCFYIDAVDEEFEHAPMYWLRCQLGLFYTTMRMLRDARLGGRLHIFICIRDLVLSAVMRSEHMSRYIAEPNIRVLNWNKNAISQLLKKKLEKLDEGFFVTPRINAKDIGAWLGRKTIHNVARGIEEPIEQYLLRHTRLLPRDTIVLGNRLCSMIQKAKRFSSLDSLEANIREAVADTSKIFGNEQLAICGNHIASNSMPKDAALHGYSEVYTGDKEYIRGVSDNLKALIAAIGKDRFSRRELQGSRKLAEELFGETSDPYSVLWQNGLLGFIDSQKGNAAIFYSEDRMDDFQLPLDKQEYFFHPCLIDSVGIKSAGKLPIF